MGGSERLIIGWTCDDCDEAIGDEPNMWDLVERFRKEHEEETGHTTTVQVVEEQRILPSLGDRMTIGEATLDLADGEIDWICPECHRSGEELETTKRCPDCDERLREVLPDGGTEQGGSDRRVISRETFEITVEIREGDIYEYWAKTDGFPHFHGSTTGLNAIRQALQNDPRTKTDTRGLLSLTSIDSTEGENHV